MTDREAGINVVREMMGDQAAAKLSASADSKTFGAPIAGYAVDQVFADIWTRPGLDRRSRSLVSMSVMIAMRQPHEFAIHMGAGGDGVFAVIITIMVLELKSPQGVSLAALKPMVPVFFSYVLSFIYVGIYWNNHHHLLQAAQHVAGAVLWANLHLLFWLSLIPFATTWIGENPLSPWPVALYGVVLVMAGLAYFVLTKELIAHQRAGSMLAISIGRDRKGALSILGYLLAIPLAFVKPWIACAFYVLVALMWLIPDQRIEKALGNSE